MANRNLSDILGKVRVTPPAPPAPASSDPYNTHAPQRKITNAAGAPLSPKNSHDGGDGTTISEQAADSGNVYWVSRHSLMDSGVACPACNQLACEANDWAKVHPAGKYGEGVSCMHCGAMLFASPDDSIDPVKPGIAYDESVYHCFARPEGWEPTRQRTTSDPVQVGDSVVIERWRGSVFNSGVEIRDQDLDRQEGKVVGFVGELLDIALAGQTGVGGVGVGRDSGAIGGAFAQVPRTHAFKAIHPTIRKGDRVRVATGKLRGQSGRVLDLHGSTIVCMLGSNPAPQSVPINHLVTLVPNERIPEYLCRSRQLSPKP